MPKNKDFKRLVRARMQKTGESYAAARAMLLRRSDPPESEYAAIAGMSNEAVSKRTGRAWREWVGRLDAIEAVTMPHRDIARHLHEVEGISGWWAQMVTVAYERIRGLRDHGQRRGGGYDVNKSRTLPVGVGDVYGAFADPDERMRWMGEHEPEIRTARPGRSLRMTWPDGTPVEVYFSDQGEAKSTVSIQHRELPTRADADRVRAEWTARIEALAEHLTR